MANARTGSDILASKSADYQSDVTNVLTQLGINPTDWVRAGRISRIWSDPSPLLAAAGVSEEEVRTAANIIGYPGDSENDPWDDIAAYMQLQAEIMVLSVPAGWDHPLAETLYRNLSSQLIPMDGELSDVLDRAADVVRYVRDGIPDQPEAPTLVEQVNDYLDTNSYADSGLDQIVLGIAAAFTDLYDDTPGEPFRDLILGVDPPLHAGGTWEGQTVKVVVNQVESALNAGGAVAGFRAAMDTTTLGGGYGGDATNDKLRDLLNFLAANLPQ